MENPTTEDLVLGEAMLFDKVMQQSYLSQEFDRRFKPIATIQEGAPIEFNAKSSNHLYSDLKKSRVEFEYQVLTDADAALGAKDTNKVGIVNLPLHSLWKEVVVQLNGKTVTEANSLYATRAYLETILGTTREVQKTRLLAEGFLIDDHGDDIEDVDTGTNAALKERMNKYCDLSPKNQVVGRPHVDIFKQDKLIPPGVDISIKFIPSSDAFVLMAATKPKIKILDATFVLHTKQLSDAAELAHRTLVLQQNYRLPYTKVGMKHFAIPKGIVTLRIENAYSGDLPHRVVAALVEDSAFSGNYGKNPYAFRNYGLKRMILSRNGVPVPRLGYTPDFTTKQYIKDYITMQEQLNFDEGDKCVELTPEQWADGFTFYVFKVTDGPVGNGVDAPTSHGYSGSAAIELEFKEDIKKDLKLVLMSQSQAMLEIDQFNNVIST